jgi:hypothetical protein
LVVLDSPSNHSKSSFGTRKTAFPFVPETLRHCEHRHRPTPFTSPETENRTPPQRQLPVRLSVCDSLIESSTTWREFDAHRERRITDRASAATDSADRQRRATESRRQNATELRNAQLSVVSCKPLLDSGPHPFVSGSSDERERWRSRPARKSQRIRGTSAGYVLRRTQAGTPRPRSSSATLARGWSMNLGPAKRYSRAGDRSFKPRFPHRS